jgi:hypothetical protein
MTDLPLEMSDEARIWGYRIEQQLSHSLSSPTATLPEFTAPDVPNWAIFVAHDLLENWDQHETCALESKPFAKALETLVGCLAQWLRKAAAMPANDSDSALIKLVAVQSATELFLKIRQSSRGSNLDGSLLQVAFASGHTTAIRMGVDLLLQTPPKTWSQSSLALSPLLQYDDWDVELVFPRILDSTDPSILASSLDIANHLHTKGRTSQHPCQSKFESLVSLLKGIVQRLELMEENPAKFGSTPEEIQRVLFDSVSLCVSLCHTMARLGNQSCTGPLYRASDLKHRRIRTEAAYALAVLGEAKGEEMLVALAADPAARSRVVAYMDELSILDRIDEKHRSILALAEADLVHWLSQVEQMGLPPSRIELVEQRTLPWPGFETQQECFLFRFGYSISDSEFSNLGVAGPATKAFSQDLANLPTDDAFAIFAGWDIEHPDVFEEPANRLSTSVQEVVSMWIEERLRSDFETVDPEFVGHFFGQNVLVGFGEIDGKRQAFAFDGQVIVVAPSLKPNPESLSLVYFLWRGRAFFEAFGD